MNNDRRRAVTLAENRNIEGKCGLCGTSLKTGERHIALVAANRKVLLHRSCVKLG